MASINNQFISQIIANNNQTATEGLARVAEKLSSGLRINHARDDAAGLNVSTHFERQITAAAQLERGMMDGISYAQIAEGALNEIHSLLQRGRELAVQAANGSLDDNQRQSLHQEFVQMRDEITRIASTTTAFGKRPLIDTLNDIETLGTTFPNSGSSINAIPSGLRAITAIPTGATNVTLTLHSGHVDDDIHIFTRDGKHLVGPPLNDSMWQQNGVNAGNIDTSFIRPENGFLPNASYDSNHLNDANGNYQFPPTTTTAYNGMQLSYSGDPDTNNNGNVSPNNLLEQIDIDIATEALLIFSVGKGQFNATATYGSLPPSDDSDDGMIKIIASTAQDDAIEIPKTPADAGSLHIAGEALDPADAARAALQRLSEAIDQVSEHRAVYAEKTAALESRIRNTETFRENTQASQSRIQDADYAKQISEFIRMSLKRDMSNAALMQSKVSAEITLRLLDGSGIEPFSGT